MSPKREENGYKIDSSFTVRLMLEYPIRRPELLVLSSTLIFKSFKYNIFSLHICSYDINLIVNL